MASESREFVIDHKGSEIRVGDQVVCVNNGEVRHPNGGSSAADRALTNERAYTAVRVGWSDNIGESFVSVRDNYGDEGNTYSIQRFEKPMAETQEVPRVGSYSPKGKPQFKVGDKVMCIWPSKLKTPGGIDCPPSPYVGLGQTYTVRRVGWSSEVVGYHVHVEELGETGVLEARFALVEEKPEPLPPETYEPIDQHKWQQGDIAICINAKNTNPKLPRLKLGKAYKVRSAGVFQLHVNQDDNIGYGYAATRFRSPEQMAEMAKAVGAWINQL